MYTYKKLNHSVRRSHRTSVDYKCFAFNHKGYIHLSLVHLEGRMYPLPQKPTSSSFHDVMHTYVILFRSSLITLSMWCTFCWCDGRKYGNMSISHTEYATDLTGNISWVPDSLWTSSPHKSDRPAHNARMMSDRLDIPPWEAADTRPWIQVSEDYLMTLAPEAGIPGIDR